MLNENNLDMLLFRSRYLKQKNYWTGKLSSQGETTDILKSSQQYRGDTFVTGETSASVNREHCEIPFDDEISKRILNICKNSELSLFIFLLSVLNTLIHKYTNHKDIIILSPIHGGKATEETINSQILIRQDVEGSQAFKEVVLNVKNSVLEAYENQDYPYEKLEEYLFPSSSPSHIACWLENIHRKADIEKIKVRLSFGFSIEREKIIGRILYDRSFYQGSEIRRLANHFILLLTGASENINARIASLEFLSEEEKKQLLNDFNNNKVDFSNDKTLPHRFEEQVEKMPDSTAIACEDRQITYHALNQRANQLANRLKTYHLQKEQPLGILFQRSLSMIESILATWKAGGAYIPLDTNDPVQRLQGILADSASPVLLCQTQWLASQLEKTFKGNILLLAEQPKKGPYDKENEMDLNLNIDPGNLAYVIYTSGSTGKPKGAMVQHIGMMNHIEAKIQDLQITSKSIVAQNASHVFDISVWQFFTALIKGGKTVIYPDKIILEPYRFISRLIDDQITILEVVPSYLAVMLEFLDSSSFQFYSLQYLLVTGETIKPGLVKQWFDKYSTVKMVNAYGPTEVSDDITHFIIEKAPNIERVPIGKPLRNLTIYILDEYLHLCPLGMMGEICVSGVGVGRGYLNNPELTAEKFKRHRSYRTNKTYILYKTGDLGCWLPDGSIEFFGRKDYQVKIRGFRIELEEIESCLAMYPGIKEAAVIIKTFTNPYLCAYLVPSSGEKPAIPAIKEYLAQYLPDHMVPDNFVQLEHMPLTSNGKIDRKALSASDDSIAVKKEYAAPSSRLEKKLVQVWADVLAIEPSVIDIDANFFELGGNSLRATVLIAKLNKALSVKIPLAQLFENPSIKGLGTYIQELKKYSFFSIDTAEEKEYYPQSSSQARLYIIQQMELEAVTYNIPYVMILTGEFDKDRLAEMFRELIHRHESLRTSFHMINETPVQCIHKKVTFDIEYHDIAKSGYLEHFVRPFDLSRAPLLRVGIIKEKEQKHILMIDMHHIITDAVSMVLLIKEAMSLYSGEKLPPLKFRYRDYSEWQTGEQRKKEIKEQEAHWLEQFADEVPVLEMPFDYPRPAVQSFEGAVLSFEIPAVLTRSINRMALDTGATLFMVLLAIYNILLSKLSQQEDIVVGTPIAARRHTDLERIIGLFINTLALRNYPNSEKNALDFINEVKENTLQAFENQEYQYEDLIRQIEVNRDVSRNPLFDTMFTLQNTDSQKIELPGLKLVPYEYENKTSKFDLSLLVKEAEENLHLTFEYSTKLFKRETIERFILYFKNIVKNIIEKQNQKISDFEMITEEEKKQIIFDFNNTGSQYPQDKTIHQLFEDQIERTPDHIAVFGHGLTKGEEQKSRREEEKNVGADLRVCPPRNVCLTYRQLNEDSRQMAELLIEKGVLPDTIVGIMVERSVEMIIGIMGILKSGGAYLPIDSDYPQERIQYMLQDSKAKIVVNSEFLKEAPQVPFLHHSAFELPRIQHSNHLCYVIYTSGSTGKPKGVMIKHQSVVNFIKGITDIIPFTTNDRILSLTTICFDIFGLEMLIPLISGSVVVLGGREEQLNPEAAAIVLEREIISIFQVTPTRLQMLISLPGAAVKLKILKFLLVGGEAFPGPLLEKVRTLVPGKIFNMYGPTETTIWSTVKEVSIEEALNIGKPIANTSIYILDGSHKPVAIGVPGELYIGGDGLTRGYLNRPELTCKKFKIINYKLKIINGSGTLRADLNAFGEATSDHSPITNHQSQTYKTGDLARWLPDGNIEFLGRIDQQVKIRGFRIELGEIENCLLKIKGVKEAVVLGREESGGDKYLCAYIVSDRDYKISELREFLAKELPDYMIPLYFVPLEKIPLTPNGKVDRGALPKPELKTSESYTAPRNEIETKLVELWLDILSRDVLARSQLQKLIGIDDNFFELGGHSLKATNLAAKIHKAFDVKVPLIEIFKMPRIRQLAEYIKGKSKEYHVSIECAEKKEYYLLSSAQRRLYILQQMNPGSTAYNMPTIIPLPAEFDCRKIEKTLKKLIKRHESLRTSFHMVDDTPVQKIHDKVEFKIDKSFAELFQKRLPEEWRPPEAIIKSYIRTFDLSQAPLLRVGLIKIEENRHVLLVDMHHIISDGVSHEILVKDYQALYNEEDIPPLRFQYKDFSEWQNSEREKENLKGQEQYWLKQFAVEAPVMDLPHDYPKPEVQNFEGGLVEFEMDAGKTRALKSLAMEENVTLYILMIAVSYIFLAKISGREDIVMGTDVAGRRHTDLENIIGMFVNTLALRSYPRGDKSFKQFLQEVKKSILAALENQEYPFEDLVGRLEVNRDAGRNPLFDVMFSFWNNREPTEKKLWDKNPELAEQPYEPEQRTAKFDLTLSIMESAEHMFLSFEYCTQLFKETTIKKFISYFDKIVSAVLEKPAIKIWDIAIVSDEEKEQLLKTIRPELEKKFQKNRDEPKKFNETSEVEYDF